MIIMCLADGFQISVEFYSMHITGNKATVIVSVVTIRNIMHVTCRPIKLDDIFLAVRNL